MAIHPVRAPVRAASLACAALVALLANGAADAQEAKPTVVELTQTACQFIEPEGGEKGFATTKKADCEAINARTGDARLEQSEALRLKPGRYVFRVTNRDVPYDLGFFLREKGYDWRNPVHQVTKTAVSGGGLGTGVTKDYEVTLKPGAYVYSCPLNTTPDYPLIVDGS